MFKVTLLVQDLAVAVDVDVDVESPEDAVKMVLDLLRDEWSLHCWVVSDDGQETPVLATFRQKQEAPAK